MLEVDGALDLIASTVAMTVLLGTCAWSLGVQESGSSIELAERVVLTNLYGEELNTIDKTSEDALLALVVCDTSYSGPDTILYINGFETYSVVLDTDFFLNQSTHINTAWGSFFYNKMGCHIVDESLSTDGTTWIITLV